MNKAYDYKESEAHRQVRLREAELMRESAADQRICRRCGKLLESADPFDAVCNCAYDDWHEEYPDIELQEDGDAS